MINTSLKHAHVPRTVLNKLATKLKPAIAEMNVTARNNNYADERASINLPADKNLLQHIIRFANKKKNTDVLIVCGIGGSNLGTIAVHEAINGKLHNQLRKPQVCFADTVDPASTSDVLKIADKALDEGKKVLVNVVTKSGTTTETIANAEVFINLLQQHHKKLSDYLVITTDRGSKLWNLANEHGWDHLEIPHNVGGRYSVFSAVGLFPLALIGVNIKQLLIGAKRMRDECINPFNNNPAAQTAALLYAHYTLGRNIHDTFLFCTDFESIGKWYRQLMAESLGKNGKGMTPTVSIGSTDLHSMAQLYLGGPADKFTTFVTIKRDREQLIVPKLKQKFERLVPAENKSFARLREAIFKGVIRAYEKRKRPFVHVELPDRSPASIGELLQLEMMQTMYLGKLLGVNAFDQPNVEEYKSETRKILRGERHGNIR